MMQIEISLDDVVHNVNSLMEGLTFRGQYDRFAFWSVGDCLIIAERRHEHLTELRFEDIYKNPMGADPEARKVWARLIDKLRRNVGPIELIPDSERIAGEILRAKPGEYFYKAQEEIADIPEAERTADRLNEIVKKHKAAECTEGTRLATLTVEQRIAEILGQAQPTEQLEHVKADYYMGKFSGTLADLKRFLQMLTADVRELTLPGRDKPDRLQLCASVVDPREDKAILWPWAEVEIFVWDDDTVEIKHMWANDLEDWEEATELPYWKINETLSDDEVADRIANINLERMRWRWSKLEKISDALRNLSDVRLPKVGVYPLKGESDMRKVVWTDEITIPGITLEAAQEILLGLAYKDKDPAMIVLFHEPGCLLGAIKLMSTSSDGKRVADELHRGTFRITPTQNPEGIRVVFQRGDFPDDNLFYKMIDTMAQALGVESTPLAVHTIDSEAYHDHLEEHEPLTLEEADKVIVKNLLCLKRPEYRFDREVMGDIITYTVYKGDEFLGIYRAEKLPDGAAKMGSIQFTDKPELEKHWNFIWKDMLLVDSKRAEQAKASRQAQPATTPDEGKAEEEKPVSHRGRRSEYTLTERDSAVEGWLNKGEDDARTLNVYLVDLSGEKDDSLFEPRPIVSRSRFYNWRTDYFERHSQKKPKLLDSI